MAVTVVSPTVVLAETLVGNLTHGDRYYPSYTGRSLTGDGIDQAPLEFVELFRDIAVLVDLVQRAATDLPGLFHDL